jgi:hypothetical protein
MHVNGASTFQVLFILLFRLLNSGARALRPVDRDQGGSGLFAISPVGLLSEREEEALARSGRVGGPKERRRARTLSEAPRHFVAASRCGPGGGRGSDARGVARVVLDKTSPSERCRIALR